MTSQHPSVLVVDDTEGNRYTVSRLLRDVGMQVTEAESGGAALAYLERHVPDLVVLDINLPDISGHDVCRVIKTATRTAAVPVMHVSASFITDADRAFGLEHGADAYLTHPLDPAVFVATARALLRADGARGRQVRVEQHARRKAETAAARATLLQDLTSALARTMSASEVSQVVLTRAFRAVGAIVGALSVVRGSDATLELLGAANVGASPSNEWWAHIESGESPMAEAARTGATISIGSERVLLERYPAGDGALVSGLTNRACSLHVTPLVVDRGPQQRVLGTMLFLWTDENAVDAELAALIAAVSDQCALALERARLYEAEQVARAAADAARKEAERANAAKAQFLATMSHELRTPLNAIGGYAELIELGIRGPVTAEQRDDLKRIQLNQQHLLGLINEVLSFAKLEAGQIEYHLQPTPLRAALQSVEMLMSPLAMANGVTLSTHECDEHHMVIADIDKLRQVLFNLISNAAKFTASGGSIRVACGQRVDDDGRPVLDIFVHDTGRGIASDELSRIFDPFVQVGPRLSYPQTGTGLGLAISRDLARGMNGDLTAQSTLGAGSTFTLTLPCA